MTNDALAAVFQEIADLLDLEGVRFKPEAYRRAARALQQLPEDVGILLRSGRLGKVPGLGDALLEKTREFVETGGVPYLEKLRAQWPAGLLQIMALDGVGPKTTRRFYLEFQVQGPEDLERVIAEGKLEGVAGFGPRKIGLLSEALAKARAQASRGGGALRFPLPEAQRIADELLDALRATGVPLERAAFAGSYRRRRETVGDLDLLVTTSAPKAVMEAFARLPGVAEVRLSGETKTTVVLAEGIQVDLRAVAPPAFGAALQYFTGSKDHNVRLRTLAREKGFSLNEYGMTREGTLVPAPAEEDVYRALGLRWIPAELRENQGEIEAAAAGELPALLAERGGAHEMHIHLPAGAGREDVEPWARALAERGDRVAGFVLRASDLAARGSLGPDARRGLPSQMHGVALRWGLEVVLAQESAPPKVPGGFDFLVARPPERTWKEGGRLREQLHALGAQAPVLLAHLEEGALAQAGLALADLRPEGDRVPTVEVAVTADGVALEAAVVREIAREGALVVPSGRPRLPEELRRLELAVGICRRAGVGPDRVPVWARGAPSA